MRLSFMVPETPHPNSSDGETLYDVALSLEKRYKLLKEFSKYIKRDLQKRLAREMMKPNPNLNVVNEWIKNRWREWILDGNYGIITHASRNRGNQAFVDSGAYYMSIYPKIIKGNKNKRIYN